MDHPRVHPNAAPAASGNRDLEMDGDVFPPLPPGGQPLCVQQLGGGRSGNSWVDNDTNTLLLLVVFTLITTFTYQLGTNIPDRYRQDSQWSKDGKLLLHRSGDPIMRDLHSNRYWMFMAASWMGFASSMVMALSLLVQTAVDSRHVRWSFAVAYSSLVLTFVVSQRRTHMSVDILLWDVVLAFLWVTVSLHPNHRTRVIQALCCIKPAAAATAETRAHETN